jgi:hypothetical protein
MIPDCSNHKRCTHRLRCAREERCIWPGTASSESSGQAPPRQNSHEVHVICPDPEIYRRRYYADPNALPPRAPIGQRVVGEGGNFGANA